MDDIALHMLPRAFMHCYGPLSLAYSMVVRSFSPEELKIAIHSHFLQVENNLHATYKYGSHAREYEIPFARALDPDPSMREAFWTLTDEWHERYVQPAWPKYSLNKDILDLEDWE